MCICTPSRLWLIYLFVFASLRRNVHAASECGVVTKNEWGGLLPAKVEYLPRPVELVIVQHTATPNCGSDSACEELVRNIQNNHMDTLGFWDIGPSFLVGGNGKVYEGSGWLHVGAHTYGYNRKSIGISAIGNFNKDQPTPEAIEAIKALIKCGVELGHLKQTYKLVAHKQLIAIESPGTKLYNEIRKWPQWLQDASSVKIKS